MNYIGFQGGSASTLTEEPGLYGGMQCEGASPSHGSAVPDADLEVTSKPMIWKGMTLLGSSGLMSCLVHGAHAPYPFLAIRDTQQVSLTYNNGIFCQNSLHLQV